jgi:hypothetical protein
VENRARLQKAVMSLWKSDWFREEICCLNVELIHWQAYWLKNKKVRFLQLGRLYHQNLWINVKFMTLLLILGFRLLIWIRGEISILRLLLITKVYTLLLDSMEDNVLILLKSLISVSVIIGKL